MLQLILPATQPSGFETTNLVSLFTVHPLQSTDSRKAAMAGKAAVPPGWHSATCDALRSCRRAGLTLLFSRLFHVISMVSTGYQLALAKGRTGAASC